MKKSYRFDGEKVGKQGVGSLGSIGIMHQSYLPATVPHLYIQVTFILNGKKR